ncbi:MAG: HEAT repeat domain-containing protein [Candidatus Heimdallarchaeota archaeon]
MTEEAHEETLEDEEITDPVEHTRVMLNALQSHDLFVRAMGVNQLGTTGREHPDIVIPKLIEALNLHADFWTVRFGAAEALGLTENPKVVKPLIPFLKDEDPDFRAKVAETLFVLADPSSDNRLSKEEMKIAVEQLLEALKDENPDVRANATRCLGYIGSQKAVDPLATLVEDNSFNVREEVAEALGRIGSNSSVGPLVSLLSDEYMKVRQAAGHALGEIASPEAVIPLIRVGLKDEERKPRDESAWALKAIGDQQVLEEINKTSEDDKDRAQLLHETNIFTDSSSLKDSYSKLKEEHLPPYSNSLAATVASLEVVQSFVDSSFRNMGSIFDLEELKRLHRASRSHNMELVKVSFKKYVDYEWIRVELFEELDQARRKLKSSQQAIIELDNTIKDREMRIIAGEIKPPPENEDEDEEEEKDEDEEEEL